MINIVQHSVTVLNIVQEGLRYFQIVNLLCICPFSSIPGVPVYNMILFHIACCFYHDVYDIV